MLETIFENFAKICKILENNLINLGKEYCNFREIQIKFLYKFMLKLFDENLLKNIFKSLEKFKKVRDNLKHF